MSVQTQEQNKELVRALYEDVLNCHKVELLEGIFAPDFSSALGTGPEGFITAVQALYQGFPDIRWTVKDLVAEGDRVTVRLEWHGTHTGVFRGFAPTGKPMTDKSISIYQVRDHQLVQSWIETDRLGLLQQMGIVPRDLGALPQGQVAVAGA